MEERKGRRSPPFARINDGELMVSCSTLITCEIQGFISFGQCAGFRA